MATTAPRQTQEERNKELIREFQKNCMHAQRVDLMGDYLHPDLTIHLPSGLIEQGRENAFSWFTECTTWFTSRGVVIKEMVAEGDLVFQLIELRFEHTGDYQGIGPTGRTLTVPGLAGFRIRDGLIYEHWGLYEMDAIPAQLGLPSDQVGRPWSAS